jgi:hypothetical protein
MAEFVRWTLPENPARHGTPRAVVLFSNISLAAFRQSIPSGYLVCWFGLGVGANADT